MEIRSIRPFVGSKDFEVSRRFYRDLGFEENELSKGFSVFHFGKISFYLQDAYVKDWIDNTMVFVEVADASEFHHYLKNLNLPEKYDSVRVSDVRHETWGSECFVHDPSGVLWHFGSFSGVTE